MTNENNTTETTETETVGIDYLDNDDLFGPDEEEKSYSPPTPTREHIEWFNMMAAKIKREVEARDGVK